MANYQMVAFVAPWCGHCKSLGPEFTAAAQSLSPLIPFYAVDCDDSKNKGLCAEYGIQGFPTIKAFPRASKGAARDYNGERKRGGLVDYAKGLVPDRVKKLRLEGGPEATLQKFLDEVGRRQDAERYMESSRQKPQLPHALLIHPSTPSIPFLWKVLGHRLSSKVSSALLCGLRADVQLHLGYIKDSASHEVISALGIHDPSDSTRDNTRAVVWQPGAHRSELIEYEGGPIGCHIPTLTRRRAQVQRAARVASGSCRRDRPSSFFVRQETRAKARQSAKRRVDRVVRIQELSGRGEGSPAGQAGRSGEAGSSSPGEGCPGGASCGR